MSYKNVIAMMMLGCLMQQTVAMNKPKKNLLGEPVMNPQDQEKFKKEWDEKREKERKVRNTFWDEQFGNDSRFKELDPRLQKSIAQDFILPVTTAKKANQTYKYCLPMAVDGLTPSRIESIEQDLREYHAQFKANYIKGHPQHKEPNDLHLTIVAFANAHGEVREILGEPVLNKEELGRRPFDTTRGVKAGRNLTEPPRTIGGGARAVIYSDGSIEWKADPDEERAIRALTAEQKVLSERLYKETLKADTATSVKLGRVRIVNDRYNQLFFSNQGGISWMAIRNFDNVQTKQLKMLYQIGRSVVVTGSLLGAWFSYYLFFKYKRTTPLQFNKPVHGILGMIGLTLVTGHLITATKHLIRGFINI